MSYPIETGNIVLMFIGTLLVLSGPYIIYRTVVGVIRIRKTDPDASIHPFSNGLNILIALLFLIAGVLFILNNLRGNPLN